MSFDWAGFNKALIPIKSYQDLCQRWHTSYSFPFVLQAYNFTMPELTDYTRRMLGGDARQRYIAYEASLTRTILSLHQAGVQGTLDLLARIDPPDRLEHLAEENGILADDLAAVLKYLTYWVIPMEKYLSALVRNAPEIEEAVKILHRMGIRSNLDLLQQGITAAERQTLAKTSGLPEPVICELVNRADFSRMPWASKATISNIIGAGYGSLAALANADAEQLYADFFRYGKSIGKNLKLGNEIENSYRIARIVPVLIHED